ncbi:hypothetical protein ACFXAZ_34430 [Streptomyces sp. NPDC059477]|uniref:hypothetical protein n=1 Tax=Streptomyces sp. NPDC059477 TaxID=3346847 RepID=UPI0036742579
MTTWQPKDSKRFARQLDLNRPYYVVLDIAQNRAPYEDAQLYSTYTFTRRLPLTNTPVTSATGIDAESLCRMHGPVYDRPPAGLRNIADRAPQVDGPLPAGYEGVLDAAEIEGLEKQVADGSDPKKRRRIW